MGRCYRRSYVPMKQSRVEAIRALLVQELESAEATVTVRTPIFSLPSLASFFQLRALRPVMAVLVLVVFGTSSLLKVASASLPGDTLYTIKLVREQAQVLLTRDSNERAKLSVQFAVNRADEVNRVIQRDEPREQKAARLSTAVAGLEQHVADATGALAATGEKKELARVVEEGAEQIVTLLSEAKGEADKHNGAIANEVTRALGAMNDTKDLVEMTANPPTTLATSVVVAATTSDEATNVIERPRTQQPVILLHAAQSVSSLPIAESVIGVGSALPFAVSVQSE